MHFATLILRKHTAKTQFLYEDI